MVVPPTALPMARPSAVPATAPPTASATDAQPAIAIAKVQPPAATETSLAETVLTWRAV
jgi:hypothetical protein